MQRRELLLAAAAGAAALPAKPKTEIAINGDGFLLNGKPTYAGRSYKGLKIEGLLMNTRMVQGVFDDLNPETRNRWAYPDTKKWDAERNVREFLAAMPEWRRHGVLSFTVNLQGGSPEGYSKTQPWETGAIAPDGSLRKPFLSRLARILDRADQLGMAPIVGFYYFGQDQRVKDEAAVKRGVENAMGWLLDRGDKHVLVEICNETNVAAYDHAILKPARVHELIELARGMKKNGRRLLVGTSWGGRAIPTANVVKVSDFLLLHGNGVSDPVRIADMVRRTRRVEGYRPMPILVNDFAAVARALPVLGDKDVIHFGGTIPLDLAPKVVLGPGTGLGVAGLVPDEAGKWTVVAGEGGHADLAPHDERELAIVFHLIREYGHVSVERVLSGPGLETLYLAIAALDGVGVKAKPVAADIAKAARSKIDPLAVEAVRLFAGWLGAVAGNLALSYGGRGGVYIAGGIVPQWGDLFDAKLFRHRFEAKGRMRNFLHPIPTYLITAKDLAFRGLAEMISG